jgi:hypothetical protein
MAYGPMPHDSSTPRGGIKVLWIALFASKMPEVSAFA